VKKICRKCGDEKDVDKFYFITKSQKYRNTCLVCEKEYQRKYYVENIDELSVKKRTYNHENSQFLSVKQKEYYDKNKVEIAEYQKEYYLENKQDIVERQKEYHRENKDTRNTYAKLHYQENRETILETQKQYQQENRKAKTDYHNEYDRKRRKTDPAYRLRKNVSIAVYVGLKTEGFSKKGESILKYLPYSIDELKKHLEKQFESWMNWDNQGIHNAKIYDEANPKTWTWNIDHIIPQSKLPYTSMEDDNFKKCWALENLRPILSKTNLEKGNK